MEQTETAKKGAENSDAPSAPHTNDVGCPDRNSALSDWDGSRLADVAPDAEGVRMTEKGVSPFCHAIWMASRAAR